MESKPQKPFGSRDMVGCGIHIPIVKWGMSKKSPFPKGDGYVDFDAANSIHVWSCPTVPRPRAHRQDGPVAFPRGPCHQATFPSQATEQSRSRRCSAKDVSLCKIKKLVFVFLAPQKKPQKNCACREKMFLKHQHIKKNKADKIKTIKIPKLHKILSTQLSAFRRKHRKKNSKKETLKPTKPTKNACYICSSQAPLTTHPTSRCIALHRLQGPQWYPFWLLAYSSK